MALRVRVCRLSDVPAAGMAAFAVEGVAIPILLTRDGGELWAMTSMCPHEDVSLADGELEDGCIRCPGHGYAFDLVTGQCSHDPTLVARTYQVTVIGDEVFVDLI